MERLFHKFQQTWTQFLSWVRKKVKETKVWAVQKLIKYEFKKGKPLRCRYCTAKFSCEKYQLQAEKDSFWHPQRCESVSDR